MKRSSNFEGDLSIHYAFLLMMLTVVFSLLQASGAQTRKEGRLWSALWDGGAVVRLGADGHIEERVSIRACKASSVTFGGSDYTDMYITTAGGNFKRADGRFAGALFRCK
jgi:sugar lactone lactonase YvrE